MTNKIIYAALLSGALLLSTSCRKETTGKVSKVVDVTYPKITLKGDEVISINTGGTFVDPGATVTDSTDQGVKSFDITADPEGLKNIDVNTPGLYVLVYKAVNTYGFESIATRPLAVTNIDASRDLSGTYARNTNGAIAVWTKLARGVYRNSNVGGVNPPTSPAVLPVYVVQLTDSTFDVPLQPVPNGYGELEAVEEKLMITPTDTSYSYRVVNPGFGTAVRTFEKQ
jgi:hypothetical protein